MAVPQFLSFFEAPDRTHEYATDGKKLFIKRHYKPEAERGWVRNYYSGSVNEFLFSLLRKGYWLR